MLKVSLYTIFMILNTALLPLFLYADVFGVKPARYISFIALISSNFYSFFDVTQLQLNNDFSPIWYRNVSPIFTNYIVFDTAFTMLFFIFYKCISNKSRLEKDEGLILQKRMNEKITAWKLNAYV